MAEEEPKEPEQKEEKNEQKPDWDKTKQEIDQYKANVDKLAEEKRGLTEQVQAQAAQLDEAKEQRATTTEKLESIEKQLADKAEQAKGDDIDNLDPDLNDPILIKAIKTLRDKQTVLEKQQEEKDKKIVELEAKDKAYEEKEQKQAKDDAKAKAKESILSQLDEEYGPKFRNEAVKMLQAAVDKGEVDVPQSEFVAYLALKKYYKELSDAAPKETTKKTPAIDTGGGGVNFKEGDVKEGTLEEVAAQIRDKYRGKGFTLPPAE